MSPDSGTRMDEPGRLRRWWNGLSRLTRTIVSLVLLLPFAEIAFWGLVELVGGRQGFGVAAGVAGACSAAVLAVSPNEVLAHPEVGGRFAHEHPLVARGICVAGVGVCLTVAVAAAFGGQLGLFKN
jgi:hypothetical protein